MANFGQPKPGDFLTIKSKSELDPTAFSDLKRIKIDHDSEIEVVYVDMHGITIRVWREGQGDVEAFAPGESWKRYMDLPVIQVSPGHPSGVHHHAHRHFPDGLS